MLQVLGVFILKLREFCEQYRAGAFSDPDVSVQIDAGWFDWFCPEEELSERLKEMWKILDGITSDYLLDGFRVMFSNHCPAGDYPLYDEVRFSPLDHDGQENYGIAVEIDDKRFKHRYVIITDRNYFEAEAGFDDIQKVQEFCNAWERIAVDPAFYEARAKKDAEFEDLCDKTIELLKSLDAELEMPSIVSVADCVAKCYEKLSSEVLSEQKLYCLLYFVQKQSLDQRSRKAFDGELLSKGSNIVCQSVREHFYEDGFHCDSAEKLCEEDQALVKAVVEKCGIYECWALVKWLRQQKVLVEGDSIHEIVFD